MSSKQTPKNTQEFIDYRLNQTEAQIAEVRTEVSAIAETINNLQYASSADVKEGFALASARMKLIEASVTDLEKRLTTEENANKPIRRVLITIGTVAGTAIIVAVVSFILNGGLKS